MKTLNTLVSDIYNLFKPGGKPDVNEKYLDEFTTNVKNNIRNKLGSEYKPTLRMSNLGKPCARQLWYEINQPTLAEPLPLKTYVKFMYGDLIEEFVLLLTKLAGHTVTDEQKEVDKLGVKGHIDAVVDGILVDVKSASPYSFQKFQQGLKKEQDGFGYLTQLGLYNDSVDKQSKGAAFVAFDKVSGEIAVDFHSDLKDIDYDKLTVDRINIVRQTEPPDRGFSDVEEGASGNRKLTVQCSYCPFKQVCWPGLRAYKYYGGPTFLTRVKKEPKVERIY